MDKQYGPISDYSITPFCVYIEVMAQDDTVTFE